MIGENRMTDFAIAKAVEWAINIANDDTHGYDQEHRTGPDYDCSSFVADALKHGGLKIDPASINTKNLGKVLMDHGFSRMPYRKGFNFSKGDIVLNTEHHVVLMIDDHRCVHASINEKGTVTGGQTGDQTGREICIREFYEHSKGWEYVFRFTLFNLNIPDQIFSYCPVLRNGSTGDAVRILQSALAYALKDYMFECDGIFGNDTEKHLRDYQKLENLEVDGICGRFTWMSILA